MARALEIFNDDLLDNKVRSGRRGHMDKAYLHSAIVRRTLGGLFPDKSNNTFGHRLVFDMRGRERFVRIESHETEDMCAHRRLDQV